MRILVAGSLHLDIVVRAPHLPRLDETVTGHGVDYVFGGKGGNQAIAAKRMGAEVSFAGRAGSDSFGDMIRQILFASDLELSQLQHDAGASGMSAAIVDDNGEYGAVIVSAANLNIEADQIVLPRGTGLVLLQNEIPHAVNLAVARQAKAMGALVWLNAAPVRPLPEALVECLDLLIVNRGEAEALKGVVKSVEILTTLGAQGVHYKGTTQPGFEVGVISTHGAGDMFVGALAAHVATGAKVEEAIRTAQAAAALHVSTRIMERSELSIDQVEGFLQARLN